MDYQPFVLYSNNPTVAGAAFSRLMGLLTENGLSGWTQVNSRSDRGFHVGVFYDLDKQEKIQSVLDRWTEIDA